MIKIKRIYDEPAKSDGFRILIDRLWPRGESKEKARIDLWLRDIAPSDELRKWFEHDPEKWGKFKEKFFAELKEKKDLLDEIIARARKGTVTLLYGAKEERYNNAVALKEYIVTAMKSRSGANIPQKAAKKKAA